MDINTGDYKAVAVKFIEIIDFTIRVKTENSFSDVSGTELVELFKGNTGYFSPHF